MKSYQYYKERIIHSFPVGFLEPEHPFNNRQPLPLPCGQRVFPRHRHWERQRRRGEVRLRPDEGGTPPQRKLPQGGDGVREAGKYTLFLMICKRGNSGQAV